MIVNLYSLYASETTANYLTIGYLYAAAYYIYVYTVHSTTELLLLPGIWEMPMDKPEIQPCNMKVKIAVYHQYTSPWWVIDLSVRWNDWYSIGNA